MSPTEAFFLMIGLPTCVFVIPMWWITDPDIVREVMRFKGFKNSSAFMKFGNIGIVASCSWYPYALYLIAREVMR